MSFHELKTQREIHIEINTEKEQQKKPHKDKKELRIEETVVDGEEKEVCERVFFSRLCAE